MTPGGVSARRACVGVAAVFAVLSGFFFVGIAHAREPGSREPIAYEGYGETDGGFWVKGKRLLDPPSLVSMSGSEPRLSAGGDRLVTHSTDTVYVGDALGQAARPVFTLVSSPGTTRQVESASWAPDDSIILGISRMELDADGNIITRGSVVRLRRDSGDVWSTETLIDTVTWVDDVGGFTRSSQHLEREGLRWAGLLVG